MFCPLSKPHQQYLRESGATNIAFRTSGLLRQEQESEIVVTVPDGHLELECSHLPVLLCLLVSVCSPGAYSVNPQETCQTVNQDLELVELILLFPSLSSLQHLLRPAQPSLKRL